MAYSDSRLGVWQLHEAKAHFSELFRLVRTDGPQRVTKNGGEAVVLVPAEQFDQLSERAAQVGSLVQFFKSAPLGGATLDLRRKRDAARDITW